MAKDIEALLRVAAEIKQLEKDAAEAAAFRSDELSEDELDHVAAARQTPPPIPPIFRKPKD